MTDTLAAPVTTAADVASDSAAESGLGPGGALGLIVLGGLAVFAFVGLVRRRRALFDDIDERR